MYPCIINANYLTSKLLQQTSFHLGKKLNEVFPILNRELTEIATQFSLEKKNIIQTWNYFEI